MFDSSAELQAALGAGDPDAIAAVKRGELLDLRAAETVAAAFGSPSGRVVLRALRAPRRPSPSTGTQVRAKVRPRARRERHVARATSGVDSGDDEPAPARYRLVGYGLDRCPCCDDPDRLVQVGTEIECLTCRATYPLYNCCKWEPVA